MIGRRTLMLAAAAALATGGAAPAWGADRFAAARAEIKRQIEEEGVPSVAVAVLEKGRIVWEEGFGWADRERRVPAGPHTMYSLASISKPITATGLMTLVERGTVDLDKPANDYLGTGLLTARMGDARQATVRRVAAHTAGLPLHYQFFYADEDVARPPMDDTIARYGNLMTAPGERYQYSNLGFGVLDWIIARSSGTPYADYMRREVFVPLGLTHTSVDIAPGLEEFAAQRYGRSGERIPFYTFDHPGASAVWSSAHDLVRFAGFHLKARLAGQKPILSDATIDAMHAPADPQALRAPGSGYGIGFNTRVKDGYRVIGHTGGMGGVATIMNFFPERDIAIVVLTNSSSPAPRRVFDKIAGAMLPGWQPTPDEPAEPMSVTLTPAVPALAGEWQGKLVTPAATLPVTLAFQGDGTVRARFGEQLPTLVARPRFKDGYFEGEVTARLPNPDLDRYHYTVRLSLKLDGTTLGGAAMAMADGSDARVRNALTHWVSLGRVR